MAMYGMDVAEVRQLASLLQQSSADITSMISKLTGELGRTTWVGGRCSSSAMALAG